MPGYWSRAVMIIWWLWPVGALNAQVKTDGSMGAKQTLAGPNFNIVPSLGRQVGGNLFHSFSEFSLQARQSATFSGPGSVKNVLARVTGGSASLIDGTVRCNIAGADLYLINPAGVVFGANAALDVRGSFVVTSADYVRLGKSGRFSATPGSGEVLSSAAPAAFGFLSARGARIRVSNSSLAVDDGKSISIVANGDVRLEAAKLTAAGGGVKIVAGGASGEIPFDAKPSLGAYADVWMAYSTVDTTGEAGGPIVMRAREMTVRNTELYSITGGVGSGAGIDLQCSGMMTLEQSVVGSSTAGLGAGGPIDLRATNWLSIGGTEVFAQTAGAAEGGAISLSSRHIGLGGAGTLVVANALPGATGAGRGCLASRQ